jgi:hypothetical protein
MSDVKRYWVDKDCLFDNAPVANAERGTYVVLATDYDAMKARAEAAERERDRLKRLLDRDQTGLAAALNEVQRTIKGWSWLARDEWGSYEWHERTEATLRKEMGTCFQRVEEIAALALKESGVRAMAAFYPGHDHALPATEVQP